MTVLVFKTNMVCAGCKQTVGNALSGFGEAIRWNADLDDCDKILRVETAGIASSAIIRVMHEAGFMCEELV
ncbi:hypothetical protein ACFSUS_26595 [Spirosoma soli]|uniref:HMA domain-containing protein n=1 Tax=Spirosoma soli TaxID=1770529 RepID=A0ABW5MCW4_9BACT